ncbi:hypothetical protein ACW5R3_03875 [Bizionia sp. KMM 8389]
MENKHNVFVLIFILATVFACQNEKKELLNNRFKQLLAEYYIFYPKIETVSDLNKFDSFLQKKYDYIDEIKNHNYELRLNKINSLVVYDKILELETNIALNIFDSISVCSGNKMIDGFFSKEFDKVNGTPFLKNLDLYLKEKTDNTSVVLFNGSKDSKKVLFKYEDKTVSLICNELLIDKNSINNIAYALNDFIVVYKDSIKFDYGLIPLQIDRN